jgi:hypothetical protein
MRATCLNAPHLSIPILAFETTVVEIRNVEAGSMSLVIQGNNLGCAPPHYSTRMARFGRKTAVPARVRVRWRIRAA